MSQHSFPCTHQGRPVTIEMGFDRPLQGFFMNISLDEAPVQADGYLYLSLDDPALTLCSGFPDSMDYFVAKLEEFGLTVPEQMLKEIADDALANVGNRHVRYDVSGKIEERT